VQLRRDLAAYLTRTSGVTREPAQVWAANGSNEVLQQVLQAFGGAGRTALGFTPSYSMHPIISAGTGTAWVDGHRREDFTIDAAQAAAQVREVRPDVVFVTSPNNPTGTAVALETIRTIYDATSYGHGRAGVVVVDEAYTEFARAGTPSALTLLPGRPRLLVSRTMSKAFGKMAGLRLGYLAADPAWWNALHACAAAPTTCPRFTQAAARTALAHTDAHCWRPSTRQGRAGPDRRRRCPHGSDQRPSDANFVLFGRSPTPPACEGAAQYDLSWCATSACPAGCASRRATAGGDRRLPQPPLGEVVREQHLGDRGHEPHLHASSARPARPSSSSSLTSTAPAPARSAPGSGSTTTC
jgi:histidinol-phosphate aminotransferase